MKIVIQRNGQFHGPYPISLIDDYLKSGRVFLNDLARNEDEASAPWSTLDQLLSQSGSNAWNLLSWKEALRHFRTVFDLGLLFPCQEIRSLQWLSDRKLLYLAAVGLTPATLLAISSGGSMSYWAVAFYFSTLWTLFFYYLFRTPQVKPAFCLICFFGTGLISIPLLLVFQHFPPIPFFLSLAESETLLLRALGMLLGVGIWEELCKAAVVFWVARRPGIILMPQTTVFYGMISGLGFGIYEGVDYQQNINREQGVDTAYFLNIARLTSLPFLHAVWTGIAGYFIGFAALFAHKRYALWLYAILAPACLHAFYNTFGWSLIGLSSGFLGVILLMTYLTNSKKTQIQLGL